MVTEDRFGRVVAHLYRAALGDATWASAAGVMSELIRTNGQSITYAEAGPGGEPEMQQSRFYVAAERRDDLRQLYYRDYYWRDEAIPRLAGLDDGELAWKSDVRLAGAAVAISNRDACIIFWSAEDGDIGWLAAGVAGYFAGTVWGVVSARRTARDRNAALREGRGLETGFAIRPNAHRQLKFAVNVRLRGMDQ